MDYIPQKLANKILWLGNLTAVMEVDFADYGVSDALQTDLQAANTAAQNAYAVSTDPATRTPVAIATTNSAVAAAVVIARQINSLAQVSTATSSQLVAAGLPVRDTTRSPQTPITDSVELEFVSAIPQVMSLQARNPATPTSKAKPKNTGGIQLAIAIGTTAAVDPSQATRNEFFTRSPLKVETAIEQRGKVATVFARYQSRGSIGGVKVYGPWSLPLVVNLP